MFKFVKIMEIKDWGEILMPKDNSNFFETKNEQKFEKTIDI